MLLIFGLSLFVLHCNRDGSGLGLGATIVQSTMQATSAFRRCAKLGNWA